MSTAILALGISSHPMFDAVAHSEQIRFRIADAVNSSDKIQTIAGEILVEAVDGGVMLRGDDGRIWTIQPEQIIERLDTPTPDPINQDEMAKRMLAELPEGFESYQTAHYLILHQGSDLYARQCGTLFESLHRAFFAYWKNQRVDLEVPTFPLVALVLRDRQAFLVHAQEEIGDTASSVIGYYHLESNRMTTFRVPNLERNIATIIHEATHQLAYNCGLQTRFADNPMWVSEGLATYFETPDLSNPRGWRGVGRVNMVNLARWRRYIRNRPDDSLVTLLSDDSRFRSAATAEAAYAECWALTYFLIRTHKKEYIDYLTLLSSGKPLREKTGRARVKDFENAMNMSLDDINKKFLAYMRRVR